MNWMKLRPRPRRAGSDRPRSGWSPFFGVHRGQHVELDAVLCISLAPRITLSNVGASALVHAIGIVHLARAVQAQPDQELVGSEELAPLVVEQHAVGLDRVARIVIPGRWYFALDLDRPAEKFESHQGGFAALPGDVDLGPGCDSGIWRM